MSRIIAVLTREGYTSKIMEHDDKHVSFIGDLDIDADGAYRAYHPDNKSGLDDLRNAKDENGRWCGIVTVAGKPVVQGEHDPAPGFYVSATSLHLLDEHGRQRSPADPRCYVDAETVPFMVVPPQIIAGVAGVVMGCYGRITNIKTGMVAIVVVADGGPRTRDGEASIAAAKLLGISPSARSGGEDDPHFLYECWPGVEVEIGGVKYPLQNA